MSGASSVLSEVYHNFSVLLSATEQTDRLVSGRIRDENELVTGVADCKHGRTSERLSGRPFKVQGCSGGRRLGGLRYGGECRSETSSGYGFCEAFGIFDSSGEVKGESITVSVKKREERIGFL
uniref:Uncharacterized protein n=1 Tax=Brassica campestris TaxID=3711 RepID=M4DBD5_BRACM